MGKLRVFFTIALIVVLLPLNAFGRHKKGDVVQDPNHSNISRGNVSAMKSKKVTAGWCTSPARCLSAACTTGIRMSTLA